MKRTGLLLFFSFYFAAAAFSQIKQSIVLPPLKPNYQLPMSYFTASERQFGEVKSSNGFDSTLAFQFQHVLDSVRIANKIMGVSVAVSMPEKGTWLGVSGMSNPLIGVPIQQDMLFDIGSNTKTFIAALMLILVDEGLVSLDDKLHRWLPSFPNIDSTVTIQQLLNHTSGISDYSNENPAITDSLFANLNRYWSPEYSLTYVLQPNFPKGTNWSYSNTNYILAGMIIKKVTGAEKIAPILRQKILDPLNLTNTFLDIEEPLTSELAHGWINYSDLNVKVDFFNYPRTAIYSCLWTAGAMVSTAENMSRWIRSLYSGQVLSQKSLEEMFSIFAFNDPTILGYGLGTMKRIWLGELAWAHGGDTISYGSQAAYFPGRDVCIVVLVSQRNYPYQDFYNNLTEQLYKRVIKYYLFPHDLTFLYGLQLASTFCRPGRDSLKITAQLNNPDNHDVQVVAKIFSIDSAFVDSTNMYDDGFHFDGQARDGQFGGCVKPLSIENEFFVRANSMDFNMGKNHLSAETARFTTIGPVVVESYRILSSDTLINPGAVVPLQFALKNNGATAIAKNIKTKISSLHNDSIRFAGYPSFGDIAAGETSVTTGTNVFILPKDFPANKNIFIKVEIFSSEFLFWLDTLQFFIYPTLVQNNSQQPPLEFALFQNYPNPFNSRTTISYQLPACGFVELTVYNINGQKISTLVARQQQAGYYHLEWDASDLPSGSYFYNLKTGSYNEMKKMTLQK